MAEITIKDLACYQQMIRDSAKANLRVTEELASMAGILDRMRAEIEDRTLHGFARFGMHLLESGKPTGRWIVRAVALATQEGTPEERRAIKDVMKHLGWRCCGAHIDAYRGSVILGEIVVEDSLKADNIMAHIQKGENLAAHLKIVAVTALEEKEIKPGKRR